MCWTNACNVKIWKDFDLDFILLKGNKVYKSIDSEELKGFFSWFLNKFLHEGPLLQYYRKVTL